jgi:enoyl-CoA hydratase/carnithine racemase
MDTVNLEMDEGGVATIRLNRPDALNIYNLAMRDDLIEAFGAVRDITEVRAVVLAAAGRHFSAGADLAEFGTADSTFQARRIRWRRDPWGPLLAIDAPVIAALHGYALGAGFEMALMCDFRLAAPDTVVGLPETKLGMLPSAGGSQTLARLVGPAAAARLVMSAENVSVADALAGGLIHEIVEEVDDAAIALARRLAAVDPSILKAARRQLRAAGRW